MKSNLQRINLQVDDYLDLLNLATQLGDVRWQKEITRKLEMTLSSANSSIEPQHRRADIQPFSSIDAPQ
ncbi:hypothetical protein MNQ98_02680 [Paenibacillus sp. N3/727]|uniref:hypothetical protein n=1 Tax=Paenibacillus sp. N3/727 TaxID=2925845 RepID=UPI001F53BB16|nr:hypothetical protein [Paenibacillus sp. N3/727]UNK21449.1 hypothetical protein MNQ98_02680 [Paenibacillus sp. N3/727]